MTLSTYDKKRNFEETSEPKSSVKKSRTELKFVVQRHHASRLHYDFRLELDGVLKSWAIPKGPSLNPKDKRLAMMVEDHPYDYRTFEGEIPKGNYGAGTVYIFDEGTYSSLSKSKKNQEINLLKELDSGSLKFKLNGKVLKGEFALVRMNNTEQNAWLLIKHNDEFALEKFEIEKLIPSQIIEEGKNFKSKKVSKASVKQEKLNNFRIYKPMLAKLASAFFEDKDYIYERKLDGYRIIAYTGNNISLHTRNGHDYTSNYQQIADELIKIKEEAVLDGEIIAEYSTGEQHFQLLQNYDNEDKHISLKFYVFDLLSLNGHNITEMPLLQRKVLLKSLLEKYDSKNIINNNYLKGEGKALFEKAEKNNWEGVIGKRAQDEYFEGKRSDSWLKFKFTNSQKAIICGYTEPSGSRKYFGSLVLGSYNERGKLIYIGNCGSGFNDDQLKKIHHDLLGKMLLKKPLSGQVNQESKVTWVRPELVCEVNFTEWTEDRHLRHPIFKGIREDKSASEVDTEIAEEEKVQENDKELSFEKKKLKVTNLNKIFWENEGYTKGDVIHYYEQIADYILPFLKDKPLSLNRHPNGINKPNFFQKDVEVNHLPDWAQTAEMHSESNNRDINYLICNDKPSLIYMANLGCIEINPWLSDYKNPNHPEFLVIDLDPDGNKFAEVIKVSLVVKEIFDQMEINCFVKTSGSTGMHIYVYLAKKYDYAFVKNFAEFVANKVHEQIPDITSIDRSPNKRKGLIYIDYLQNRKGQTIAAPYSLRPKPGATVSMPLSWNEVNENLDMMDFDILSVPELIKKIKNPWRNINELDADLIKGLMLLST